MSIRPERPRRWLALVLVALAAEAATAGAATAPGAWRALPRAPISPDGGLTSVWTGKQAILFGTRKGLNVAAAYDPATRTWRRLPSGGNAGVFPPYRAVWTGKEMLVWGQGTRKAFDPRTNRWRRLPGSPLLTVHEGHGLVVWTGREMIGWGGGCCGDAFSDGVAYNPATNRWRALPRAPLAGSQRPVGAWTGRELIVLVGNLDPDGRPWPARLARAAAYNPATNRWRRIAPIPEPRNGATAVWDGRELLVVGGAGDARGGGPGALAAIGFAYDPATSRWRRLPAMESGRTGFAALWTGRLLLVWGGSARQDPPLIPPHGLAYDPASNAWSALPPSPLLGRLDATGVWTGRELFLWGGQRPKLPLGTGTRIFLDGATFTPSP